MRLKIRKMYLIWSKNPFHPSLRFKCVNHAEDLWSVRITRAYRVLGIMEGDTVTWFSISNDDDYERLY